jgi:hypothetical protein
LISASLTIGTPGELNVVGDVLLSDDLNVTVEFINVSVTGVVDEESHGDVGIVNKDGLEGVDSEVTVTVAFTHGCDCEE